MPVPTVLISGAGIAGPSLTHWLAEYGYRVMVVELAPGVRPGGQTVDLRGSGRDVIERMGLLEQMTARSLRQRGAAWVRAEDLPWIHGMAVAKKRDRKQLFWITLALMVLGLAGVIFIQRHADTLARRTGAVPPGAVHAVPR